MSFDRLDGFALISATCSRVLSIVTTKLRKNVPRQRYRPTPFRGYLSDVIPLKPDHKQLQEWLSCLRPYFSRFYCVWTSSSKVMGSVIEKRRHMLQNSIAAQLWRGRPDLLSYLFSFHLQDTKLIMQKLYTKRLQISPSQ